MTRGKQLWYDFGLVIAFPRLALFSLACLLLFGPFLPNLAELPVLQQEHPGFVDSVLLIAGFFFLLSLVTNIHISRYLHRHQSESADFDSVAGNGLPAPSRYFRIRVQDQQAFRVFLQSLKHHSGFSPIKVWLWLDDLWPVLPLTIIGLLLILILLLALPFWAVLQAQKYVRQTIFQRC